MPNINQNSSAGKAISKDILHDARVRHKLASEIFTRSLDETLSIGNAKNIAIYAWIKSSDRLVRSVQKTMEMHCVSLLSRLPNVRYVKLYADNSLTRSAKNCGAAFHELLEDCKNGTFDLVITQSLSCLNGDPICCVNMIKELLALPHPVGVFFVRERINTLDPKTMTLLSMLAEHAECANAKKGNNPYS